MASKRGLRLALTAFDNAQRNEDTKLAKKDLLKHGKQLKIKRNSEGVKKGIRVPLKTRIKIVQYRTSDLMTTLTAKSGIQFIGMYRTSGQMIQTIRGFGTRIKHRTSDRIMPSMLKNGMSFKLRGIVGPHHLLHHGQRNGHFQTGKFTGKIQHHQVADKELKGTCRLTAMHMTGI